MSDRTDQHRSSPTPGRDVGLGWCQTPSLEMVHDSAGNTGVMLSWSSPPMAFISPTVFVLSAVWKKSINVFKKYISNNWKTLHTHWPGQRTHLDENLFFVSTEQQRKSTLLLQVLFCFYTSQVCDGRGATRIYSISEFNDYFKRFQRGLWCVTEGTFVFIFLVFFVSCVLLLSPERGIIF